MASAVEKMDAVSSRAEVKVTSMDTSPGQGEDGSCTVIKVVGEGPISSPDPRLQGIFKADSVMVVNDTGEGAGCDDWEIVDADTGEVKARGTAHGVINGPTPIRAVSIGRFSDGAYFFAHARVSLPTPGTDEPLVIEYGGPENSDPENRAVAVHGNLPPLLDPS